MDAADSSTVTPRAVSVYSVWMVHVNVYLPDDLAAAAKEAGVNLSAVTQQAVRRSLAARSTDAWLSTLTPIPSRRVAHELVLEALDQVRDEPSTRHV